MENEFHYSKTTGLPQIIEQLGQVKEEKLQNHTLFGESDHTVDPEAIAALAVVPPRGIQIRGWTIAAQKNPISPAHIIVAIEQDTGITPPEMIFGNNLLALVHQPSGIGLQFLANEALRGTLFEKQNRKPEQLKVPMAKIQTGDEEVKELDIPYDWTFTTNYSGTISRFEQEPRGWKSLNSSIRFESTEERIDYQKLQEREPILWFDEVNLYEDELHDHGISELSIKIRVMPSGFYILSRFWMRLDQVVMRLNETRLHHLFGTDVILREYTSKEANFKDLFDKGHPSNMLHYTDINQIQQLLEVKEFIAEKIYLN